MTTIQRADDNFFIVAGIKRRVDPPVPVVKPMPVMAGACTNIQI
jgi:hypothetical protein